MSKENYLIILGDKKFYGNRIGQLIFIDDEPLFKIDKDDGSTIYFKNDEQGWVEIENCLFRRQCPHCESYRTIRNGIIQLTNKQRYKCMDCEKQFSHTN